MRYNYIKAGNKVIAISRYAGRCVRGVAKCHTEAGDTFDERIGNAIARLRCDIKIDEKRMKNAAMKVAAAERLLDDAEKLVNKMREYQTSAEDMYNTDVKSLEELLASV